MAKNESSLIAEIRTDIKWIKEYLISLDKRKANKWTEAVIKFMLSGAGIAIIAALMGLILAPRAFAFGQSLRPVIDIMV